MSFSRRRRVPLSAPRRRRDPLRPRQKQAIGVLVLVALAACVYAVFVRAVPWSQPFTVRAIFSGSAQITPGSPVRIAGINVGEVTAVGRGPGTTAAVTMAIDHSGRPLHEDATATIRPRLFLEGSYYVDLHPGSPSARALGSGATLPLPQTAVPVSFSTVLSTFNAPVRQGLIDIIDGGAHALADGGAAALHGDVAALVPAFRETAIASEGLIGTGPDDVTNLVEGAARVTSALASQAPALTSAIEAEADVAGTLANNDAALGASVTAADATLREAPAALSSLSAALPELRSFAAQLDPSLRIAPGVLASTAGLLGQVRSLTASSALPRTLTLLRLVSTQLTSLAPKLEDLFPRVKEIASCTGNQLVSLLDTKLQDGKLTTGQPVWQELAHVNVGLASANQDFDAAGTRVRFATNIQPNLLALGSVPGVGALLENTEQPLLGIRPVWNGPTPPPVHPEVPCTTQPLGNLQAGGETLPSDQGTRVSVDMPALVKAFEGTYDRAKAGWSR